MKKTFLISIFVLCSIAMSAKTVVVTTSDYRKIECELLSKTDTTVTIVVAQSPNPITIGADRVVSIAEGRKVLIRNINGKLIDLYEETATKNDIVMTANADPNVVIGKAIKKAGAVSLAFGIPCLAAGLATCIAGHSGGISLFAASDCLEASYYLLGTGAAMTIVGIPLYVEGKKMSEIKFNCTGNGVGISASL